MNVLEQNAHALAVHNSRLLAIQIELAVLTARMHATIAGIEGMKADSADRIQNGHTVAYEGRAFDHETVILNKIAEDVRALAMQVSA